MGNMESTDHLQLQARMLMQKTKPMQVTGQRKSYNERQCVKTTRANGHGYNNDNKYNNNSASNQISKTRSSRWRHSKSHANHEDVGNLEGT